jgi:type II pantothenate kinase
MIFVDNSGADIVFGILPFTRYLLQRGTQVVLAANTHPSVNDITAKELSFILENITEKTLSQCYKSEQLKVVATGSGAPCLSFVQLSEEVSVESKDVDLVVIEGMGRAIHTNFYAKFMVDCVKIGAFKNPQIAKELGAKIYDALLLFEPISK